MKPADALLERPSGLRQHESTRLRDALQMLALLIHDRLSERAVQAPGPCGREQRYDENEPDDEAHPVWGCPRCRSSGHGCVGSALRASVSSPALGCGSKR